MRDAGCVCEERGARGEVRNTYVRTYEVVTMSSLDPSLTLHPLAAEIGETEAKEVNLHNALASRNGTPAGASRFSQQE